MRPLNENEFNKEKNIKFVLTDIDGTLTTNGRLPKEAYIAMERLQNSGIKVIPITGRPAGWCDHMARMWPIDGIVGENGAFYFCYLKNKRKMVRQYWRSDKQRLKDRTALNRIKERILNHCKGAKVSADQAYREADLAIDFCEDVSPLPMSEVDKIVNIFEEMGAKAKISSIHVNGWFGEYDKLSMTRKFFLDIYQKDLDNLKNQIIFVGDSPNDAPMFGYFPNSIGVANVNEFIGNLFFEPTWVTKNEGGQGFAEIVDNLLKK